MTVMAPAIAALFGIGVVTMWQDYRRGGWRGWLLPIALVATVAEQVYILSQYPTWGQWLIPPLVVLGGIAVGALLIARIAPRFDLKAPGVRFLVPALTAGVLVLMLAPMVWAASPILTSTQADTLVAGPTQTTSFGGNVGGGPGANSASSGAALISYLEAHQGTAKYLVAVSSSRGADAIILATNKPVMTLGGFSGSDPILTTSQLAALVESGQVKYFLLSSSGGGGAGGSGQSALMTWIQQHSKVVPSSQWQSSSTSSSSGRFGGAEQLYEYTGA
jgi:4-amino-4-deoxy-L-arabinose transferase-like glycosyltransferase